MNFSGYQNARIAHGTGNPATPATVAEAGSQPKGHHTPESRKSAPGFPVLRCNAASRGEPRDATDLGVGPPRAGPGGPPVLALALNPARGRGGDNAEDGERRNERLPGSADLARAR